MRTADVRRRFRLPSPTTLLLGFCAALAAFLFGWSRAHWWQRMPWGLTNIWWDLAAPLHFRSLSVSVDIADELPDESRVYIAPIGLAWLNDIPFYCGLMVGAPLPGGGRGRVAIFSRWHERSRSAIRVAPGGFCESAGYEGNFISVRNLVPWRAGRYTLTLSDLGRDAHGDGVWVGLGVRSAATGETWNAGALRFPGATLTLRPAIAAFVEIFGAPMRPRAIPTVRVRFGDLRVNGSRVSFRRISARYRTTVPPFAKAWPAGDGAVAVEAGRRFRRAGLARERAHYTEDLDRPASPGV
jgi:hypothetical protein